MDVDNAVLGRPRSLIDVLIRELQDSRLHRIDRVTGKRLLNQHPRSAMKFNEADVRGDLLKFYDKALSGE